MHLPAINSSPAPIKITSDINKPRKTPSSGQANTAKSPTNTQKLSESDSRAIAELKTIDRGVRTHEAAHIAAAGGLVRGGANFSYTQGPDGQRYAVGGEVSIDTSPERDDPEATILKAQRIQAAALAPAQPSDTDRAVAASAAQMAIAARAELAAERNKTDEPKIKNSEKTIDNGEKSDTASETRQPSISSAEELRKTINHVTEVEATLGRLLNTTV